MALTKKRKAFIEQYLQCFNASEAARRAGYSERSAGSIGHENLNIPEIAEEIERRIAEMTMTSDEVLTRLTEQARGDYAKYIRFFPGVKDENGAWLIEPGPYVDVEQMIADGKAHLIKKWKRDRDGRMEVEFYDAQSALVHMGRYHQLFNVEVTGKDGGPIRHDVSGVIVYVPDNGRDSDQTPTDTGEISL